MDRWLVTACLLGWTRYENPAVDPDVVDQDSWRKYWLKIAREMAHGAEDAETFGHGKHPM